MKKAYFWSVQWTSVITGNRINSDGGPYCDRHNAESSRDRCLEQISRNNDQIDNHYVEARDVEDDQRMIEDMEADEYIPRFEIAKTQKEMTQR